MVLESLKELTSLYVEAYIRKVEILVELNKLYIEEELLWAQKCNGRWLLKGDNNIAYFQRVVNGRRRKK